MLDRIAAELQVSMGEALRSVEDRKARGLSMLEYALMALISIVIFGGLLYFLTRPGGFFDTVTGNMQENFDSTTTGGDWGTAVGGR